MKANLFRRLIALLPLIAVMIIVSWVGRRSLLSHAVSTATLSDSAAATAKKIDQLFVAHWKAAGVERCGEVDDLQILRRLSLALHGAIPALQEIRQFEADTQANRLQRWTARMLQDERFAEFFAARLSVSLLGETGDDFPKYRREHFIGWLRGQLQTQRPFDAIVRDMIAESGFPSSHPAANFITAEIAGGEDYENRLASRVVRVFLGQRIDCAQCHDHPFDDWKQADFQGLAAFFGPTQFVAKVGLLDDPSRQLEVDDLKTSQKRVVEPCVPFADSLLQPDGGSRRRLAAWVTHSDNRRFPRAVANRLWELMFGQALISPVDEIPDPLPLASQTPLALESSAILDLLADDLRDHHFDLHRTIEVIASTKVFRLSSQTAKTVDAIERDSATPPEVSAPQACFIAFPLVHLRPEQLLRSLLQASSVKPIAYDPNLLMKPSRYALLRRFLRDYGDFGNSPADEKLATIPQTLVMMNGPYVHRFGDVNPLTAAGRIAALSRDDAECIDNCFLVCLTRRPTPQEREYFSAQLKDASSRGRRLVIEDLVWSLFNSAEFTWSH